LAINESLESFIGTLIVTSLTEFIMVSLLYNLSPDIITGVPVPSPIIVTSLLKKTSPTFKSGFSLDILSN